MRSLKYRNGYSLYRAITLDPFFKPSTDSVDKSVNKLSVSGLKCQIIGILALRAQIGHEC